MRRALSILFLNIMMLVAIQPVVAMHFCGGELHSLELLQAENNHSCCITLQEDVAVTEGDICHYDIDLDMELMADECCDFDTVEVSTDNFQQQANRLNLLSLFTMIENDWFTINNLFALNQPEMDVATSEIDFPPKGLFMEDVSILNYICIYRI